MNSGTPPTDPGETQESNSLAEATEWKTPSSAKRTGAKILDFLVLGIIYSYLSYNFDSIILGLICGYGWLSLSDWKNNSPGKSFCKLKVIQISGPKVEPCSVKASFLRNLPIVLTTVPSHLHRAILNLSEAEYRETFPYLNLGITFLTLAWLIWVLIAMTSRPDARHPGDLLAGTRVVMARQPSPGTSV